MIININELINEYLNDRQANERFASFDYCYDYFYSFYRDDNLTELASEYNIQMSCLQLGFYLASWGMMRNSFIMKKSVKNFENLIIAFSEMPPKLWEIDVDTYTERNVEYLMDCKDKIKDAFGENKPSDTLITKIMLGVFANVPAFDNNFKNSTINLKTFNKNSLIALKDFYEKNKTSIDSFKVKTIQFSKGNDIIETDILYTKAKLIDMYGFMDGMRNRE
ncbi:hypothetical protein [Methanobacterium ferruginis]|uniref:hypothetical protein n=1 Tax=Methanobacterium ferruginis TaxID=710191 RepID=UPI00257304C2|nr:hypothetical protein [Methanobacterium ferruginis]BDZ68778.1 hypothetical protein GCM10025860_22260 [Methanobacterium ferruginis]